MGRRPRIQSPVFVDARNDSRAEHERAYVSVYLSCRLHSLCNSAVLDRLSCPSGLPSPLTIRVKTQIPSRSKRGSARPVPLAAHGCYLLVLECYFGCELSQTKHSWRWQARKRCDLALPFVSTCFDHRTLSLWSPRPLPLGSCKPVIQMTISYFLQHYRSSSIQP